MKAITQLHSHKLPPTFYIQKNVCTIAKALIGKVLVTCFQNRVTTGRIVETEAYNGITDRASHAWNGRRTSRTETMYQEGGVSYVYLCYGMHHLFNVVTNQSGIPHAVLVRAVHPLSGKTEMLLRTGKNSLDHTLTRGPGNVTKALGIQVSHTGKSLQSAEIFIADDGFRVKPAQIVATSRIGVDYAGEDAGLLYRFFLKDDPFVSGKKVNPQPIS